MPGKLSFTFVHLVIRKTPNGHQLCSVFDKRRGVHNGNCYPKSNPDSLIYLNRSQRHFFFKLTIRQKYWSAKRGGGCCLWFLYIMIW